MPRARVRVRVRVDILPMARAAEQHELGLTTAKT